MTTCISSTFQGLCVQRAHCVSDQRDPFFDRVLRLETRVASMRAAEPGCSELNRVTQSPVLHLLSSPSSYKVNLSLHSGCESIVLSMESVWEECCLHLCPLLQRCWLCERGARGECSLASVKGNFSSRLGTAQVTIGGESPQCRQ